MAPPDTTLVILPTLLAQTPRIKYNGPTTLAQTPRIKHGGPTILAQIPITKYSGPTILARTLTIKQSTACGLVFKDSGLLFKETAMVS
jgi:hypothetical protein